MEGTRGAKTGSGSPPEGGELPPLQPTTTARPLTRGPRVLIGRPLPLAFGLDKRLLLKRRGKVCV